MVSNKTNINTEKVTKTFLPNGTTNCTGLSDDNTIVILLRLLIFCHDNKIHL